MSSCPVEGVVPMAQSGKVNEELLTKIESTDSPGEESKTGGPGKSRGKKESINTKDYRKKKKDALQGKENKEGKGHKEEESEGKHGHSDHPKEDASDKGGKTGAGPQGQSNLQSGQTTVQFSSGGGAGSFGSLLALFASSASLVRAEVGAISTLSNQTTLLNLQNLLRSLHNQSGSLLGEEGKSTKDLGRAAEQVIESVGKQFNFEIVGSLVSHRFNNSQDIFSTVLKNISAHASDKGHDFGEITKIPLFSIPFILTKYEGFNANTFFFDPAIPFAFSNTPRTSTQVPSRGPDGEPLLDPNGNPIIGFVLENNQPDAIDKYFKDADLEVTENYTYEVLSPIVTNVTTTPNGEPHYGPLQQPISQPHGITTAKVTDLTVNVAAAEEIVSDLIPGLTLTEKGELYSNVDKPLSILVNIKGGENTLPVRINVGPGAIVDTDPTLPLNPNFPSYPYYTGSQLTGTHPAGSDQFGPTVFRVIGDYEVVGNASAITLNSIGAIQAESFSFSHIPQNFVYVKGLGGDYGSVVIGSFDLHGDYIFPSSTIFRHTGTSNETVPNLATYGNFSTFRNIDFADTEREFSYSTLNFDGNPYNLTFGGNVLDVFGTKYGAGDRLDILLATDVANSITMGSNTLAGFGLAVGDIGKLNIGAANSSHESTSPTTLTFNGNIVWVDKNVDSILYPHLQDLNLGSTLTDYSNLKIVFKDSILHGNLGADEFYGDIENIGDRNNPLLYNAFINGVEVTDEGGHVVTTPPPSKVIHHPEEEIKNSQGEIIRTIPAYDEDVPATTTIQWGNNIYVGGADPEHTSSSDKNINTYHFTLLGTNETIAKPIMLGHALITDFDINVDTLDFQLTPALFRSLDFNHDKAITAYDLNFGTEFHVSDQIYNRLIYQNVVGTVINFSGGGSLSLQGITTLNNFFDIPELQLHTDVNISYIPIKTFLPEEITATSPSQSEIYIYGQGPDNDASIHSYYFEFDNFFDNSLFATYTYEGTDPLTGLPINVDHPLNNVIIDQYGSITVNSDAPYIVPLTITGSTVNSLTNEIDTDISGPHYFGFLNAPISILPDGITSYAPTESASNILIGGLDSIIIGGSSSTNTPIVGEGLTSHLTNFSYGSNLIVNTTDSTSAKAYGNFETVVLSAQGTASNMGSINNDTFNFKSNAFYVNGAVLGVATSLQLDAKGGINPVIQFNNSTPHVDLNVTGNFDTNTILIGSQLIYGNGMGTQFNQETGKFTGGLTGDFSEIIINVTPGTIKASAFQIPNHSESSDFSGSIDASGIFQNNTIYFGATKITILGDSSSQTSLINANVVDLSITAKSTTPKVREGFESTTDAIFKNNHIVFGDATLTGGNGHTIFQGHLDTFSDAYNSTEYRGFATGVTVSYANDHLTITDSNFNSITWGNNTYAGGLGANTYNFTIVKDLANYPIMQGFDTLESFDLSKDTLVFNVERSLYESLQMHEGDSNLTLAGKLNAKGVIATGGSDFNITFIGPGGVDTPPYGKISISNLIGIQQPAPGMPPIPITSLSMFLSISGRDSIVIKPYGDPYTQPVFKPGSISTFDPIFQKVIQPLAFAEFVETGDPEALTWGTTNTLPDGFELTSNGTLEVFQNSDGKTPIDAFINVTIHDDIFPNNIITIPALPNSIHIFALNTDTGQIFTNATTKGSTGTEIFQTTGAAKIIGGGDDIIYNGENPTTAVPLIYGSKLIYDITGGGHTVIGDVEKIQFINTATHITTPSIDPEVHLIAGLDRQTITFSANMFNINSGGVGEMMGNNKVLELIANGGRSGSLLVDATINNNILYFGPNTFYTVGSGTISANNSFIVYANMKTLTLAITNPSPSTTESIGDSYITRNEFHYGKNKLVGSSDTVTLNPGIGTLNIENLDTSTRASGTENLSSISENKFLFDDSKLIGGTGRTFFNADIADLSNTDFVLNPVTVATEANHLQVTDINGNVITWGNNSYEILSNSQGNTLTFTLFTQGGADAVMQGNAEISGFRINTDTLILKLAPELFRSLNTIDYDRKISIEELDKIINQGDNSGFTKFIHNPDIPNSTTLEFGLSLAAGSITFLGQNKLNYAELGNITPQLAYTPAPITVRNPELDLNPLIIALNGSENHNDTYVNILDTYFDHMDIGDAGSTYEITASDTYHQTTNPDILFNPTDALEPGIFDEFGTATAGRATSPILTIINAKPNDVHFTNNTVSADIVVAAFNGAVTPDTNPAAAGTIIGSLSRASYLQGDFANETMVGNTNEIAFDATNAYRSFIGLNYGTDLFGGNLIINTKDGNKGYGVSRDIHFSANTTSITSDTSLSGTFIVNPNALYVNGTAYGVAEKLLIELQNTIEGSYSLNSESNTRFELGQYDFRSQTLFGQGTLIGALGLFQISVKGNTTASITGDTNLTINAFTEVRENVFNYAPTNIVVLGDEHSSIFPHINSLSFFLKHGNFTSTPVLDTNGQITGHLTFNAPAVIEKNEWVFEDSVAIGGSGGVDYYPDINDLSSSSFWSSDDLVINNIDSHVTMTDLETANFTNIGNNKITWGNNKIYLSSEEGSLDTIHVNVLKDASGKLGIPGKLDVYNFDATEDTIQFNLSIPLYKSLNGGSTTLNGSISAVTLGSKVTVSTGANTEITFDYGSLVLHDLPGHSTLTSFPNIQVGTTLIGSRDQADSFIVNIPTSFSNFKEFDHIAQFNPAQDALRLALSPTAYNQLSQYGLLSGSDLLTNFSTDASNGISITQKDAEYALVDPTFTGADVDSSINFVTNDNITGSVTLHNVAITDLNVPFIQLGQQATAASDTFYFVVPGSDLSTFTGNTFISGFNNTSTNGDNLEITVSKDLFDIINPTGTAPAATALAPHGSPSQGILVTPSGTSTVLSFQNGASVGGSITLEGLSLSTDLSGLGTRLHLGYIESGTTGVVDTFSFHLSGTKFGDFNQFNHITNFNPIEDTIQITVPVALYNTINTEGDLDTAAVYAKLVAAASSATGGITTNTEAAHYPSPQYGTGTSDFHLNFTNLSSDPLGMITVHNVNGSTSLTNLGTHFQFGSSQAGTADEDTFRFNAPAGSDNNFSEFQQFNHITGFDLGTDNIDIALSKDLFDSLSPNNSGIISGLVDNSHSNRGDINVVIADGSTNLQFVDGAGNVHGAITLDNVTLTNAPGAPSGGTIDLDDFGSNLHFGFIEKGTGAAENFQYDYAANPFSNDLSGWQNFSHLLDFNTANDTLTLKISELLNNTINDAFDHNPFPFPAPEQATNAQLLEALSTGFADGHDLGTKINVVQTAAQYGTGHDSILQFMTGGAITGSLTLHNVSITSITDPLIAPQITITTH